ncbi:hypothetical protein [Streptomyces sp. NPDC008121]|uniref:hypothetical protein n=1 Tax=Streptomyces sp. NPDC008121 TaxID=3364809 RepID=UPI0036E3746C
MATFTISNNTGAELRITKVEVKGPRWSGLDSDAFVPGGWMPQPGDTLDSGKTYGLTNWGPDSPEVRITAADISGRALEFGTKVADFWGSAGFTGIHSEYFEVSGVVDDPRFPDKATIRIGNR